MLLCWQNFYDVKYDAKIHFLEFSIPEETIQVGKSFPTISSCHSLFDYLDVLLHRIPSIVNQISIVENERIRLQGSRRELYVYFEEISLLFADYSSIIEISSELYFACISIYLFVEIILSFE